MNTDLMFKLWKRKRIPLFGVWYEMYIDIVDITGGSGRISFCMKPMVDNGKR